MSKLGQAILALVEESYLADIFHDGLLFISSRNLFKAAALVHLPYQKAVAHCNQLGIVVLS